MYRSCYRCSFFLAAPEEILERADTCPECGGPLSVEPDALDQAAAVYRAKMVAGAHGIVKGNVDAVAANYLLVDPSRVKVVPFLRRPHGKVF